MSNIDFARQLVQQAKDSERKVAVVDLASLPGKYESIHRVIKVVSDNQATVRVYRGKMVVVDLSWID